MIDRGRATHQSLHISQLSWKKLPVPKLFSLKNMINLFYRNNPLARNAAHLCGSSFHFHFGLSGKKSFMILAY